MRRILVTFAASCMAAASLLVGPSPNADAIVAVPCYEPRSLCFAALQIPDEAHHRWHLLIARPKDRYFSRYRLCVKAPDGSLACDVFRIARPRHHLYFYSMITWNRHFPDKGSGRYSARWRRLPNHTLIGTRGFTVH